MRSREDLRRLDQRHVWHPYTQAADHAQDDYAIIARAEGRRLFDIDGRAFWDGVSSIWLNVHGHRVPEIDAAIRDQLDQVAHSTLLGQANVPSIELAAALARAAPDGLSRVFFSDNGSTAVEAAIKMAIQTWHLRGRQDKARVLSFEGGYHGDTLGCVGAAFVPQFHAPFSAAVPEPGPQLPFPDLYRGPADPDAERDRCLEAADAILRKEALRTAAVIVEPVQGVGGVRVPPAGWLAGLRALCDEHEVLLIADEVATGFGRTGALFACGQEGVRPDLMALGKGITGGYLPLAATLATEAVHDEFVGAYEDGRQFFHGHSYTGNQLGCAAGLASLRLLDSRWDAIAANAAWLAREMASFGDLPHVGDVRGRGFMWGIELVADKDTKEPFPWPARAAWRVYQAARQRGLLARPYGNVCLFLPPLGSTRDELAAMLSIYRESLLAAAPALAPVAA